MMPIILIMLIASSLLIRHMIFLKSQYIEMWIYSIYFKIEYLADPAILLYIGGVEFLLVFFLIMLIKLDSYTNKKRFRFNIFKSFKKLFLSVFKFLIVVILFYTYSINIDIRGILIDYLINYNILDSGLILYIYCCFYFIWTKLILFIAMMGVLILVVDNAENKKSKW